MVNTSQIRAYCNVDSARPVDVVDPPGTGFLPRSSDDGGSDDRHVQVATLLHQQRLGQLFRVGVRVRFVSN